MGLNRDVWKKIRYTTAVKKTTQVTGIVDNLGMVKRSIVCDVICDRSNS